MLWALRIVLWEAIVWWSLNKSLHCSICPMPNCQWPITKATFLTELYTHSVLLVIQTICDWFAISDYDVIFTALGGKYKAKEKNIVCPKMSFLWKFHGKNFLKIQEFASVDDSESKKRLRGVWTAWFIAKWFTVAEQN